MKRMYVLVILLPPAHISCLNIYVVIATMKMAAINLFEADASSAFFAVGTRGCDVACRIILSLLRSLVAER
jgi:hypothetical protein